MRQVDVMTLHLDRIIVALFIFGIVWMLDYWCELRVPTWFYMTLGAGLGILNPALTKRTVEVPDNGSKDT